MQKGVIFEGEIEVWMVKIHNETLGRGYDHDEYFDTEQAAIFASALDGKDLKPTPVKALKFSDGTFLIPSPGIITVQKDRQLHQDEKDKILSKLSPAQQLLLAIK